MKHLAIVLIFILMSCKNEPKTETKMETDTNGDIVTESESESQIDQSVYEMWNNYIKSNPEFKNQEIPESDFFHNNREDANRLAVLTINGKKKASSGLYSLYKQYNVDIPKVGTKQIITDFDGKAKAIIENSSVDTIPFNKISKDYAELDMGTDIEPLEKWKKAHWDFFESVLEESGEKPTEEMLVVCVTFETIWTEK
ncbi:ASCH domain-containing protein [Aureibaculum algae]|uniref:ASCH domain-containing protein n=1 Tax=Aureibaculum algae TaxID=2584122 RepID=A0A5B7TTU5_9FLAO|nr:ASCH domain-containing protein [Aureibaculum algae]QCX38634.1 ASCH domain-containing protein [Aureibaculum algae]